MDAKYDERGEVDRQLISVRREMGTMGMPADRTWRQKRSRMTEEETKLNGDDEL